MVYHLVRPVARYVLRYYYRNIDLTGLENIPADAPVILAVNHPTATKSLKIILIRLMPASRP
jgi:1-acyl-sn-glycerol-3-phosphate acyltransferase